MAWRECKNTRQKIKSPDFLMPLELYEATKYIAMFEHQSLSAVIDRIISFERLKTKGKNDEKAWENSKKSYKQKKKKIPAHKKQCQIYKDTSKATQQKPSQLCLFDY